MKTTIEKIKSMKGKEKIAMLTGYDYFTAKMEDGAIEEIDMGFGNFQFPKPKQQLLKFPLPLI